MRSIYFWSFVAWLVLITFSLLIRKKRPGRILLRFSYIVFILFLLEITCLLALKVESGFWLFNEQYNLNAKLFEPHPYLVGVPRKNASLEVNGIYYSNNSSGFRGKEFKLSLTGKRIIAIGGSTTYGTSVSDWETWPYYLDSLLKPNFEVLNFGVSGHSTVEHIIQASLIIPEYKPDIVLVHCGLNDLRSMHIKNLAPDYTDFHAPNLYGALGFCPINELPRLAALRVSVMILQKMNLYPECSYYQIHAEAEKSILTESRALELYKRNLFTLINILESQHIKVVFIPQLLNEDCVKPNKLKWWIPFVEDEDLPDLLDKYNQVMQDAADSSQCVFADDVLKESWKKEEFADPSHLNPKANLRFAQLISKYITKQASETKQTEPE